MRYKVYTWDHDCYLKPRSLHFSQERAETAMRTKFFNERHDGAAVIDTWTQYIVAVTGYAWQTVPHINNLLSAGETDIGMSRRLYDCVSSLWMATGRPGAIAWDTSSGTAYLIEK